MAGPIRLTFRRFVVGGTNTTGREYGRGLIRKDERPRGPGAAGSQVATGAHSDATGIKEEDQK